MIETETPPERAYLVGVELPRSRLDGDDSLDELGSLVEAAGGIVAGRSLQARRTRDPNSYVGKGKAGEIGREVARLRADIVVCDDELKPSQQRTLEEITNVAVVDRSAVILDIFALHARSREGRIQVELAQLEYRLPRLTGRGKEMSRLGGGIGTRGPGESKLESDRQIIRKRIQDLRKQLEEVARQRERARGSRTSEGLFLAAIVGYTNAGKSTLMNALAGSDVLVADQPFATLDPTTRRAALAGGATILLSDTVGFVNKLPPTLVAAFRATLEELADADLLVHVADVTHPNLHEHMRVVDETLKSLDLSGRPRLLVFNQTDRLRGEEGDALREALGGGIPRRGVHVGPEGRRPRGVARSACRSRVRELEAREDDAALPRRRARPADPHARLPQERGLRRGRDTHRRERPACSRRRNPVRGTPLVAGAGPLME